MSYHKITPETIRWNQRIGARVKTIRELKGMSQSALSKRLGFTSSGTMSLIETGKRGIDLMTLGKIARALDTYPEIITDQRELSREELIALDKLVHILKDPQDPRYTDLLLLLK